MLILYEIHVWQRENSSGGYEAKMEEAGAGAGGKGVTVTDNNNNNNQYLPAVGITTTSSGGDRDKSTEAGSELEGHTKATAASSGRVIGFGNYKLTTTQLKVGSFSGFFCLICLRTTIQDIKSYSMVLLLFAGYWVSFNEQLHFVGSPYWSHSLCI